MNSGQLCDEEEQNGKADDSEGVDNDGTVLNLEFNEDTNKEQGDEYDDGIEVETTNAVFQLIY
jgi:hypothetical protein